ncbi:hypothetical protein ZTR_10989 [Talaromyces verruculosus]|nr:hypothetical protein ZTR_10989 [Talaromyces verruculosus]
MAEISRPVVVIVGASFGGIQVAKELLASLPNKVKVVLINPSDRWYFNIAAPRIIAKPKAFQPEQYLISIEKGFSKYSSSSFEFVKGTVEAIDVQSKVITASTSPDTTNAKSNIPYDYLVIASGSSTNSLSQGSPVPFKPTTNTEEAIREAQNTISKAKSIIIGGGGPIGVEFAGELAEAWANRSGTSITLVTNTKHLLPSIKEAAGVAAEKTLAAMNVRVITSQKVTDAKEDNGSNKWIVTLASGEIIKADVYVSTTGVNPNNGFIPTEFLSSDGWVDVDEHFRVKGKPRLPIFAIGDITTQPIRTSMKISEQVPVVVGNLKAEILKTTSWVTFKPNQSIVMMVPIGASTGTGQMMGMKPWGKFVAMIKGKDFFVSKAAKMVGLA